MKSFQEYAFEKATKEIFQEVGEMLGQMGNAMGTTPGFNAQQPSQNQTQNPFNLKGNPQFKKFLTGHDERSRALNQWMQRPHNTEALNQHYQGDAQRWKQDFQKTVGSWLGDQTQSPTMLPQYFTKQLGLPAGVLQ